MTPHEAQFESARKLYPGTKRGFGPEWDDFRKKHRNWKEVLPLLYPAIEEQSRVRKIRRGANVWTADWKNFKTWLYQGCWTEDISLPEGYAPKPKPQFVPKAAPEPEIKELTDEEKADFKRQFEEIMNKGLFRKVDEPSVEEKKKAAVDALIKRKG